MEQEDKNMMENGMEEKTPPEEVSTVDKLGDEQLSEKSAARPKRRTFGRRSETKKSSETESEYIEKVLSIRRVTKVTKGGKKMSFSALVVVGDAKGNVGYAQEKAGEVATAIRKAMSLAKKSMVKIPMKGTTIPHEIIGAWGAARVLLKPAADGTGVIASGPVRAICDGAGIHNILTKCHRSNNPVNVVKATMDGLTRLKTAKH
jgi:small subunit ribosomal protein S5